MPTMTFLTIPNGTVGYQDSAGTGTLGNDGSVTYASGYWAGVQGAVGEALQLPDVSNAADPAVGSMVVRLSVATLGSWRDVLTFGASFPSTPLLSIQTGISPANVIRATGYTTPGTNAFTLNAADAVAANAPIFVYVEWDAAGLRIATEGNAKATLARSGAAWLPAAGPLNITSAISQGSSAGVRIDGVAIFDAALTDAERLFLHSRTTPWTWGMSLTEPYAGYIDVLPSPGSNADAPVLVLP